MQQFVRSASLEGAHWLNHSPLSDEELRGKIVLLDFFTYCCMNCLNVLGQLKELEREFQQELLVIGIHSGKHSHEKEDSAILDAMYRYKIEHIVINDANMKLWESFAIKAWPSLVLIDPEGYVVRQYQGEGHLDSLKQDIKTIIDKDVSITHSSIPIASRFQRSLLYYPQQVLCSENHLFISQMDEVLVCTYEGEVIHQLDVPFAQGMMLLNEILYVCASLEGKIYQFNLEFLQREAWLDGLRNPYSLESDGKHLYVSLAGAHQIKAYDLSSKEEMFCIGQFNSESLHDGKFEEAVLAQPSGIALLEDELWFTDSESSSLRCASEGRVVSHIFDNDEFQHPLDICVGRYGDGCGGGRIFIADSYNNEIKVYNPQTQETMSLIKGLSEPSGIDKKGCELYIANSNAHEIIIFDLSTMTQKRLEIRKREQ